MIECYKTDETGTHQVDAPVPGAWISIVDPDSEDRAWMMQALGIVPEFVSAALDDEEQSHVDFDDDTGQRLVIVDCPFVEDAHEKEDASITQYDTHPLSVLFVPEHDVIVTVTLKRNQTIDAFTCGSMKGLNTNHKTRLLLQMMLNVSQRYIRYLRNLDRQFNENERLLRETMSNRELIKMLGFEKSLVYFRTSLKSVEATLTRISSGRVIRLYEEDHDLLDDVFIEIRQAIEMCGIYTGILNGTMDAFGSVINNNMNATIRRLTIITLVLAIPTIIFSFYGMNTADLPMAQTWLAPLVVALVASLVASLYLSRSSLLK